MVASTLLYSGGIVAASWHPWVSILMIAIVAVLWLLPPSRERSAAPTPPGPASATELGSSPGSRQSGVNSQR